MTAIAYGLPDPAQDKTGFKPFTADELNSLNKIRTRLENE